MMSTQLQTEDPQLNDLIRKEGAKAGIPLGIIITVISILSLYLFVSITSFWLLMSGPFLLNMLVPFVVAILFVLGLRKKIGGYWSFKQALTGTFVMMLVALVISSTVSLAFQKLVEPDIEERMVRNISNATIEFMEGQGLPDDQIDEAVAQFDQSLEALGEGGTVLKQVQGFFISIIVLFVIALIFAAIFKREKPVFLPINE